MAMQAQQEIRVNAAPLTATFVLLVGLAFGAIGGYAIGTAERSITTAIPSKQQVVPQLPTTLQIPAMPYPQNIPDVNPTFDEGRVCTPDLKICREPQNSYD
jgi:hypothetical protein